MLSKITLKLKGKSHYLRGPVLTEWAEPWSVSPVLAGDEAAVRLKAADSGWMFLKLTLSVQVWRKQYSGQRSQWKQAALWWSVSPPAEEHLCKQQNIRVLLSLSGTLSWDLSFNTSQECIFSIFKKTYGMLTDRCL